MRDVAPSSSRIAGRQNSVKVARGPLVGFGRPRDRIACAVLVDVDVLERIFRGQEFPLRGIRIVTVESEGLFVRRRLLPNVPGRKVVEFGRIAGLLGELTVERDANIHRNWPPFPFSLRRAEYPLRTRRPNAILADTDRAKTSLQIWNRGRGVFRSSGRYGRRPLWRARRRTGVGFCRCSGTGRRLRLFRCHGRSFQKERRDHCGREEGREDVSHPSSSPSMLVLRKHDWLHDSTRTRNQGMPPRCPRFYRAYPSVSASISFRWSLCSRRRR